MDHIAILNKKWGMLEKIILGQKTIESRWYKTKRCPWDRLQVGESIYFKNSGEPVSLVAKVGGIDQISDLSPGKVRRIIQNYGKEIGIPRDERGYYFNLFKEKKYCIFVHIEAPQLVEPFNIDKNRAGFCPQSAWLSLVNINSIRI